MRSIDRRAFLGLSLGAMAWACARGEEDGADVQPTGAAGAVSVQVTGIQLAVGDSRQGFAVFRGRRPYVPDELAVRLQPPEGDTVRVEVERQRISFGQGGDEPSTEISDIFTIRREFEAPGVWTVDVVADGRRSQGAFQVSARDDVPAPLPGEQAIASESPTTSNARGVDPICTRDPQCSMHDMTIAEALRAAKPTVIVFATPRFCTSRTCGPVVDIVEEAKENVGDDANFVHIEVWRNDEDAVNKPDGQAPTFAEWKLDTEPWVYFIDSEGEVRERWVGALGRDEVVAAVEELVRA